MYYLYNLRFGLFILDPLNTVYVHNLQAPAAFIVVQRCVGKT